MSNTWELIKEKREAANKLAADMSKMVTEKRGSLSTEEQTKFDTMSNEINVIKKEVDNLTLSYDAAKSFEQQEEKRSLIGRENISAPVIDEKKETEMRSRAFGEALRYGYDKISPELRSYVSLSTDKEFRNLTAGGIGVVGNREFANQLFVSMKNYAGPIDAGAYSFSRSDGNPFTVMGVDDTANKASVVAEGGDTFSGTTGGGDGGLTVEYTDPSTQDPTFTPVTFTPKKYSSKWILLSLELLQDNAFNAEQYIYQAAAERIGRKLNTDATTILKTATVGATTAANSAITYADWVSFTHSLNWSYRKNKAQCKIEISDSVLAKLRGIVDSNQRPIFLNYLNPQEGVTEVLDGFNYVINDDLDAFAGSATIAAIADHSKAYGIANVVNPVVVRADQLFMQDGMVGYIVFNRYDFEAIDGRAARIWKVHA